MRFTQLVQKAGGMLSLINKTRTLLAYRTVQNSILLFVQTDPELKEIFCFEFIHTFEEHLQRQGKKRNTISFYMRMLRSLYNKAVAQHYCSYTPNLFAYVFTGLDPTTKRAISPGIIYQIEHADLSDNFALEFARDMFMFCLHTQGMAFVDLAYLKKSDIQNGCIGYRRKKTNSYIFIPINKKAKKIISKYAAFTQNCEFVFPIITSKLKDERTQYLSALRRQNRALEKITKRLQIKEKVTTHCARHTWATIASNNKIPTRTIKQALGHQNEKTTEIYLGNASIKELNKAGYIVDKIIQNSNKKTRMSHTWEV